MSFVNKILQNTRRPHGFWGRMILRGMNRGHARMARWGMSKLQWQPWWTVLDVGCGGGANLIEILRRCHKGKAYGIDISPESVAFARKTNKASLGSCCFVEQGSACSLPFGDGMFNCVTAFETIYFWEDLGRAFREVRRVLCEDGCFLVCCEAGDPESTVWTSRIEGMRVYSAAELERKMMLCGFSDVETHCGDKDEICVIGRK